MMKKPWLSGPRELLIHGIEHLKKNTDFDNRMSLICIDNSVELSIKTYLGLPERITGISICRKKYEEICRSFPDLLSGLENYAVDAIGTIDIGTIEWCHRIRNEIYHRSSGTTVEIEQLECYAEIAIDLFKRLFEEDFPLESVVINKTNLAVFLKRWNSFIEDVLKLIGQTKKDILNHYGETVSDFINIRVMEVLLGNRIINIEVYDELKEIYKLLNSILYDEYEIKKSELDQTLNRLDEIKKDIVTKIRSS